MSSSNQWVKVVLILAVVVSVAVTMKLGVPLLVNFAINDLPAIWLMVVKPPYLYLVINGIIISIAASTRFNQNHNHSQQPLINPDLITSEPPIVVIEPPPATIKPCDLDVSTSYTSSPPKFNLKEKRILTSRFPKRTSQGARALRVLKPKKHDSMDTTWKKITEGRHLRKSDTFVNIQHSSAANELKKAVKKSESFKDRTNNENENQYLHPVPSVVSGGNLNSLTHDELNNRVEAFIKKFNDDMKLQRQQSLNQYGAMLKSGLH